MTKWRNTANENKKLLYLFRIIVLNNSCPKIIQQTQINQYGLLAFNKSFSCLSIEPGLLTKSYFKSKKLLNDKKAASNSCPLELALY